MNLNLFSTLTVSTYRVLFCLLIGLGLLSRAGSAQTVSGRRIMMFGGASGQAVDTVYLDIDQDIAVQLIPFEDMVKLAIASSPVIKYQNELANSFNSAYALSKTQIWQNVSGFANYATGNQALISSGTVTNPVPTPTTPGTVTRGDNTLQIANGYRVGVEVRFTLFDLFGRKHLVQQAYSNYRAANVQKEVIAQQLKRELINIYQDINTTQQILKVRLTDEQASLTAMRIAEAENQQGRATADQVAMATNRYAQAKSFSEDVKGQFMKNIHQFETLLGVPIQRLKRIN